MLCVPFIKTIAHKSTYNENAHYLSRPIWQSIPLIADGLSHFLSGSVQGFISPRRFHHPKMGKPVEGENPKKGCKIQALSHPDPKKTQSTYSESRPPKRQDRFLLRFLAGQSIPNTHQYKGRHGIVVPEQSGIFPDVLETSPASCTISHVQPESRSQKQQTPGSNKPGVTSCSMQMSNTNTKDNQCDYLSDIKVVTYLSLPSKCKETDAEQPCCHKIQPSSTYRESLDGLGSNRNLRC